MDRLLPTSRIEISLHPDDKRILALSPTATLPPFRSISSQLVNTSHFNPNSHKDVMPPSQTGLVIGQGTGKEIALELARHRYRTVRY